MTLPTFGGVFSFGEGMTEPRRSAISGGESSAEMRPKSAVRKVSKRPHKRRNRQRMTPKSRSGSGTLWRAHCATYGGLRGGSRSPIRHSSGSEATDRRLATSAPAVVTAPIGTAHRTQRAAPLFS